MADYARLLRVFAQPDAGRMSDLNPSRDSAYPPGRVLRDAAVLVPIWLHPDGGTRLVLTKRASHLIHHPGQISFPGGKIEKSDVSPVAAALREAQEEMGLPPERVEILGSFPAHEVISAFMVTPVIGVIRGDFTPHLQESEVAELFSVPLSHVVTPENFTIERRLWQGQLRGYYTVPYGPYYIWGATARILRVLAARMQATGVSAA